jgi:hypothetical protein
LLLCEFQFQLSGTGSPKIFHVSFV